MIYLLNCWPINLIGGSRQPPWKLLILNRFPERGPLSCENRS